AGSLPAASLVLIRLAMLSLWRWVRFPRDLAETLLRAVFAESETTAPSLRPYVRLVVPEPNPITPVSQEEVPETAGLVAEVLAILRQQNDFCTAEELAFAARARGLQTVRATHVRDVLKSQAAPFLEVRLRDEAGARVAEFRARPLTV